MHWSGAIVEILPFSATLPSHEPTSNHKRDWKTDDKLFILKALNSYMYRDSNPGPVAEDRMLVSQEVNGSR